MWALPQWFVKSNSGSWVEDDRDFALESLNVLLTQAKIGVQDVTFQGNDLVLEAWVLLTKMFEELQVKHMVNNSGLVPGKVIQLKVQLP